MPKSKVIQVARTAPPAVKIAVIARHKSSKALAPLAKNLRTALRVSCSFLLVISSSTKSLSRAAFLQPLRVSTYKS